MEYNLKHYAFIGDCVWEIFVKELVIKKTALQNKMHTLSSKYICATAQADILEKIYDKLTPQEAEIQKRGRNLKISINKKNNPALHSLATSFEVLLGYLYLNNKERLDEILNLTKPYLEELT